MRLTPFLSFNGCAEEAATLYAQSLSGTVTVLHRYGDCMPDIVEEYRTKILHLELVFDDNTLLISDAEPGKTSNFGHFGHCLTIHCDTTEQIESIYLSLSNGGTIKCPLDETFFAKRYAEFTDRYGVDWALIIE